MNARKNGLGWLLSMLAVMMGVSGCPQPTQEPPDAFRAPDAFVDTDALVAMDARGDSGRDAAATPDAVVPTDAPFDGGPPDAAGPPCTTPGSMRTRPCPCLRMRIETCISGAWRTTEQCNYEGDTCEPGTIRPYDNYCSVGLQRCTDGCTWGPLELTTPRGECEVGNRCPGASECICRADCTCPLTGDRGECLP